MRQREEDETEAKDKDQELLEADTKINHIKKW